LGPGPEVVEEEEGEEGERSTENSTENSSQGFPLKSCLIVTARVGSAVNVVADDEANRRCCSGVADGLLGYYYFGCHCWDDKEMAVKWSGKEKLAAFVS
jgi:hypothetical protein